MFILDQVVKFCYLDFQAPNTTNTYQQLCRLFHFSQTKYLKSQTILQTLSSELFHLYSSILLSVIVQVIVILCFLLFLDNINILNISIKVLNHLATIIIWYYPVRLKLEV